MTTTMTKTNGTNIYELVTKRILEQLDDGVIPWEKPWVGTGNVAFNRISKKPYSFFNQLLLRSSGEYATFKQWSELGGHVKKGAKSQIVVFWKPSAQIRNSKKADEGKDSGNETKNQFNAILRCYHVFPISEVEGVDPLNKDEYPDVVIQDENADAVISAYLNRTQVGLVEEENGCQSYYDVKADSVTVPKKVQFKSTSSYYGTLFHELAHSTGHPKRLNRFSMKSHDGYGSASYSKEELVAEIGSASLLNILHMETEKSFRNNAAYIQGWSETLKRDPHCIVSASSRAQKAVDMILGVDTTQTADNSAALS